jgi:GNAT superfamily N-acetyltransferase
VQALYPDTLQLRLALPADVAAARAFFARCLAPGSPGVYNEEFHCPLGVKAAIQRGQMLLALDGQRVVAALRFYPKKSGEVSLYQFAVDPAYRGQHLARALCDAARAGRPMRAFCPADSSFNAYYRAAGWLPAEAPAGLNGWRLADVPGPGEPVEPA